MLDRNAFAAKSPRMRLLAPAKINLHLRVGPRRADGFHSLLSWMTTIGLFDSLSLDVDSPPPGEGGGIALQTDMPGLPCDARNLVVRVIAAWIDAMPREAGSASVRRVRAVLEKRVPVGGGLGGGSSDAVRTLLALNHIWRAGWPNDRLSEFAARFGSDLSFFVYGPSSVCRGRGEFVEPIAKPAVRWVLLVLPPFSMPTADVYREFDRLGLGKEEDLSIEPDWNAWATLDAKALLRQLVNDLEPAAFAVEPRLTSLRESVERIVMRPVRMSGSGASLFTLYDNEPSAKTAASNVSLELGVRAEAIALAPDFVDDLSTTSKAGK